MGCTRTLMSGVRRLHWNIWPAKAHHAAADVDREDDPAPGIRSHGAPKDRPRSGLLTRLPRLKSWDRVGELLRKGLQSAPRLDDPSDLALAPQSGEDRPTCDVIGNLVSLARCLEGFFADLDIPELRVSGVGFDRSAMMAS
jgi:hypothetical protein